MRSSRITAAALLVVVIAADASPRSSVICTGGGAGNAADELRRAVEHGPLYRALAESAPLAACDAEQANGHVSIAFYFRDSGFLRIERDATVEYTREKARAGRLFRAEPMAILENAERVAFGSAGCGMVWQKPSMQAQRERPHARVSIYRGDVCSCRAEIVRDEQGRLERLALDSAC